VTTTCFNITQTCRPVFCVINGSVVECVGSRNVDKELWVEIMNGWVIPS
jgi:hypothetical protein